MAVAHYSNQPDGSCGLWYHSVSYCFEALFILTCWMRVYPSQAVFMLQERICRGNFVHDISLEKPTSLVARDYRDGGTARLSSGFVWATCLVTGRSRPAGAGREEPASAVTAGI